MSSLEFKFKKINETRNYFLEKKNIMTWWVNGIKRHVSI